MRRCPNGHAVPDDVKYCPTCGSEIKEQADGGQEQYQGAQQAYQQQPDYQHTDPRNVPLSGYSCQLR